MLQALFAAYALHSWRTAEQRQRPVWPAVCWGAAAAVMLAADLLVYNDSGPLLVTAAACGAVWLGQRRWLSRWALRVTLSAILLVADLALGEGPVGTARDIARGLTQGYEAGRAR